MPNARPTSTSKKLLRRALNSAVFWSWVFNALRLASGLFLLPLLLRVLTKNDLGMYYVFLTVLGILPVIDAAFSFNLGRYIGYAMGGAVELQALGGDFNRKMEGPNHPLLWRMLFTTRTLYQWLSLVLLLVLGIFGTLLVYKGIPETSNPAITWAAWTLTVLSAVLEIYSGWWNVYLRSMNQVVLSGKLASFAYALRLGLAALLLVGGAGLLALPAATLASSFLQRRWSRIACLRLLGDPPSEQSSLSLLAIIWPTSWRVGLQLLSLYLCQNGFAFLCLEVFGLQAYAQYGLSLQIVNIAQSMAAVWTAVKWPMISQLRARQDLSALRQLLWPRIWLQNLTFLALLALIVFFGQPLIEWWRTDKSLLPHPWLLLLGLNVFFEMEFSIWTIFLATENRIPSLWPTVVTNLLSFLFALAGIFLLGLGLEALVLAPLASGSLFNYWYWLLAGARNLGTTWPAFTFRKPRLAR